MAALSALTPEDATEQIFPQAQVRGKAGHNASVRNEILYSAQAGQIMTAANNDLAYQPQNAECKGASMLKPALLSTAGGVALKFAPQAFAAGGPIVGGIVLAVAGLSELFGAIFGHHAKAVAKERSILCAAVPSANQSLQLIDQAVSSGQATPQQAIAALDSMVSGFQQAIAPIIHGANPMSSGECNAACVMLSCLRGVVLVKKSQYQDLADAQAKAAANPVGSALAPISAAIQSAGLPSWALPAAGFLLLWKLL
jgi:hypothetical protein